MAVCIFWSFDTIWYPTDHRRKCCLAVQQLCCTWTPLYSNFLLLAVLRRRERCWALRQAHIKLLLPLRSIYTVLLAVLFGRECWLAVHQLYCYLHSQHNCTHRCTLMKRTLLGCTSSKASICTFLIAVLFRRERCWAVHQLCCYLHSQHFSTSGNNSSYTPTSVTNFIHP